MSLTVVVGLVVAAVAWGVLFGLGRAAFWARAVAAGSAIGLYAILAQRSILGELLRPTITDLAIGVAAAIVLYGVFWVGDRMLRRWLPESAAQVDALYQVRSVPHSDRLPIPAVLLLIGPCEELFWRGLVQARAGFAICLLYTSPSPRDS